MVLKFAWREIRHSIHRLGLVIFILSIGFIGPFFASGVRSSVQSYLEMRSRHFLSADLSVNALRPLAEKEIGWLKTSLRPTKLVQESEFVTMAKGRESAVLVEIKGVDPEFPVYGEFQLKRSHDGAIEKMKDASALSGEEPIAWVFPEVLTQLGLSVGDKIGIGDSSFRIDAVIEEAPGASRTVGFAPRVYIARKFIEATGLTAFGAQVHHRAYMALPVGLSVEAASEKVTAGQLDPELFLRTPDDSIQGFERFFRFFNLYLVALTMIVFVLSWAGAFYVLQLFLQERLKSAAILMVNGASRGFAGSLIGLQVFIVLGVAFLISSSIAWTGIKAANHFLASVLPEGFTLAFRPFDLGVLAVSAVVSAIAFNGPFFVRLYFLKLQRLLGETAMGEQQLPRVTLYASYGPLILMFLGLAAWLMGSWADAFRVAGGMVLAAIVGWGAGRFLFRAFFLAVRSRPGLTRLVATRLARSRFGMNLCFLALVLVALALNLVPHLLKSAVSEIQPLEGREIPAFFLFNIPESGVEELKSFAARNKVELKHLSPMVLGRLQKVNGRTVLSDRLQRFPVRLSYRQSRLESESLIAGRDFSGVYNNDDDTEKPAEISVEERFAERNGFKLGDEIEFDVQGMPILTKVTGIRRVKWTSFNPNFFIMFQPGVIDEAPKSWIANLGIEDIAREKASVQFALARSFPDISVVDIGRTVTQVLETAREVIGPVSVAAWVAMVMSFLILVGVVRHNLKLREPEVDIEKLLGADASTIRRLISWEYGVASVFAWFVGAASSVLMTWIVTRFIFEIPFRIEIIAFVFSAFLTIAVAVLIAWLTANRILRLRSTSVKL